MRLIKNFQGQLSEVPAQLHFFKIPFYTFLFFSKVLIDLGFKFYTILTIKFKLIGFQANSRRKNRRLYKRIRALKQKITQLSGVIFILFKARRYLLYYQLNPQLKAAKILKLIFQPKNTSFPQFSGVEFVGTELLSQLS